MGMCIKKKKLDRLLGRSTYLEQFEHQRQDGLDKSLQVLVAGDTVQNLQQHFSQMLRRTGFDK